MAGNLDTLQSLVKALEAGGYNAAPSTLVGGAALQVEDLSPVMHNVTFENSHIKLQKKLKVETCKSTLSQFDRQLSYGSFGGSAQIEGAVGQEDTSEYVRVVVPMAYYSHVRRVTLVSTMVDTVDGKNSEERAASDAAIKLAADVEFDLFRGKDDFSNAGVYDGNPLATPALPSMQGVGLQVRQSDAQRNSQDAMFGEYGSDDTVVVPGGGTLSQSMIEDAHVRSLMNHGEAETLLVDPKVLSAYNKISYGKERIILSGSPQDATAADLRKQWVSAGVVNIETSRFLSGKTRPQTPRSTGPAAPTVATGVAGNAGTVTTGSYWYSVTSANELGESPRAYPSAVQAVTLGEEVSVTITPPGSGTVRYFNVYRGSAGAAKGSEKFIGRVVAASSGNTVFKDLGNKIPGFVTGYLVQDNTMAIKELCPYSRAKLAQSDLTSPEAHFRFATLAVFEPRKNVLIENLVG